MCRWLTFYLAGLLTAASPLWAVSAPPDIPVAGKAGPGLEHFDELMKKLLVRHGIPGAALAVVKDGRLVLARGYGWANIRAEMPARPETLFALASVSKALTAAAILKLVDQGKLRLDDRAFELLKDIEPPRGAEVDPRLRKITVRMLLNHSGGWNRKVSGDVNTYSRRVARRLGVLEPVNARQLVRYMLGVPLDFDPGTEAHYSNFGFVLLGVILSEVTGKPYGEAMETLLLNPVGMSETRLRGLEENYFKGEAHRYNDAGRPLPPRVLPMMDAAGGWSASAVDLARFLAALDGSAGNEYLKKATYQKMLAPPPPPLKAGEDGYFGLGWDRVLRERDSWTYRKGGSLPGARTLIEHDADGLDWIILFNSGGDGDEAVTADARKVIERAFQKIRKWPEVDYFKAFGK